MNFTKWLNERIASGGVGYKVERTQRKSRFKKRGVGYTRKSAAVSKKRTPPSSAASITS